MRHQRPVYGKRNVFQDFLCLSLVCEGFDGFVSPLLDLLLLVHPFLTWAASRPGPVAKPTPHLGHLGVCVGVRRTPGMRRTVGDKQDKEWTGPSRRISSKNKPDDGLSRAIAKNFKAIRRYGRGCGVWANDNMARPVSLRHK